MSILSRLSASHSSLLTSSRTSQSQVGIQRDDTRWWWKCQDYDLTIQQICISFASQHSLRSFKTKKAVAEMIRKFWGHQSGTVCQEWSQTVAITESKGCDDSVIFATWRKDFLSTGASDAPPTSSIFIPSLCVIYPEQSASRKIRVISKPGENRKLILTQISQQSWREDKISQGGATLAIRTKNERSQVVQKNEDDQNSFDESSKLIKKGRVTRELSFSSKAPSFLDGVTTTMMWDVIHITMFNETHTTCHGVVQIGSEISFAGDTACLLGEGEQCSIVSRLRLGNGTMPEGTKIGNFLMISFRIFFLNEMDFQRNVRDRA